MHLGNDNFSTTCISVLEKRFLKMSTISNLPQDPDQG